MDDRVTVVIPVGPFPANTRWLDECLDSVKAQTHRVDEILLIDDMAGLPLMGDCVTIWHAPWRLGVATAFNCGVALAANDLVFMLGSDDWLEPDCIEECVKAYRGLERPGDAYLFVGVRYTDGREQFLPCNAAMVTKRLWQHCGGFPLETASGAPDAALMSIMHVHRDAGRFVGVRRSKMLYNYRVHNETDTAGRGPWQGVITQTRDIVTRTWSPPQWARFQPKKEEVAVP